MKRPGVVTFVADVSGSMAGPKLEQTKLGLFKALDGMAKTNSVGFITFADGIKARVNVGPVRTNRFAVANAAQGMRAAGNTALYDAIKAGVEMVDSAPGDEDAIRGVVVLTDGLANSGNLQLPDLVQMSSPSERPIVKLDGPAASRRATDARGAPVRPEDVIGTALAQPTQHRVLIFFVGIGNDADMQIGRILAEATGAAFTGTTEKDLAAVLGAFGRYF